MGASSVPENKKKFFVVTLILEGLRHGTDAHHARLERKLDLLNETLTRQSYVGLLQRFHQFYQPFERRMMQAAPCRVADFYACRRKEHLLSADLAWLGEPMLPAPVIPLRPSMTTRAERLGALYVVEGSMLGGAVLARHFRRRFRFGPAQGLAFFSGYGSQTADYWREACVFLEKEAQGEDAAILVGAAVDTFLCIEHVLCGPQESAA